MMLVVELDDIEEFKLAPAVEVEGEFTALDEVEGKLADIGDWLNLCSRILLMKMLVDLLSRPYSYSQKGYL